MRTVLVLLAIVGTVISGYAAKRVTIAQLEQELNSARSVSDAEFARRVSDWEPGERVSAAALAHLNAAAPGEKSRQALALVAARSSFLDLPPSEIPQTPAPDLAEQRRILGLAVKYVAGVLPQLPNFFATRKTARFEDTPLQQGPFSVTPYQPLHLVGSSAVTVLYRNGREEVDEPSGNDKTQSQALPGLSAWGLFGPILSTVLTDAARSKLAWGHREQGAAGVQAVFTYEVPKSQSHYQVVYCCFTYPDKPGSHPVQELPGYHGEIAVDPGNGAILRLTVVADLNPSDPITRAAVEVEYAPVEIGGRSYVCPVKSVSLSTAQIQRYLPTGIYNSDPTITLQDAPHPLKTLLNEITFDGYHVFRTESRILPANESSPESPAIGAPNGTTADRGKSAEPVAAAQDHAEDSSQKPDIPLAPSPGGPPEPATAAAPAGTSNAAPTDQMPAPEPLVFKTTTREVVLDVVVTKTNGDPVLGLGKQDFAVSEDGKPQAIDFFEEHTAGRRAAAPPPAMPELPPGAHTNIPPAPESDAVNVLLLDTLNTEQADQAYVRGQMIKFLEQMQPGTRVAIFMLGSRLRFVQGFTSDTSLLIAALKDKRNNLGKDRTSRSRSEEASNAAEIDMLRTMQASPYAIQALQAAQAEVAGYNAGSRAAMTFEALNYLGQYLAGIPGRKNLIWFAESFPVILFPTIQQREQLRKVSGLPGYLDKMRGTANLFTLSKIAVYPVGAEGVMTEHINDASESSSAGSAGHFGSGADTVMAPYNGGAAARADTIYAMEQLAASTGGKAYYNTNDLNGAMQRAINDGSNYYTITYAPTNKKMDGAYRQIEVKLNGERYKVAYRRGYNADDAAPPDAAPTRDPLAPLLAWGLPAASGVLYGVQIEHTDQASSGASRAGENASLPGPVTRYSVNFVVRTQDVGWSITPNGDRTGQIIVGLKAYDRAGNAVNWEANIERLEVPATEYAALEMKGIPAHIEIDLPAGDLRLVTAVYDWNSGKAGTLELAIPPN